MVPALNREKGTALIFVVLPWSKPGLTAREAEQLDCELQQSETTATEAEQEFNIRSEV
jgi:hypothetical protein